MTSRTFVPMAVLLGQMDGSRRCGPRRCGSTLRSLAIPVRRWLQTARRVGRAASRAVAPRPCDRLVSAVAEEDCDDVREGYPREIVATAVERDDLGAQVWQRLRVVIQARSRVRRLGPRSLSYPGRLFSCCRARLSLCGANRVSDEHWEARLLSRRASEADTQRVTRRYRAELGRPSTSEKGENREGPRLASGATT